MPSYRPIPKLITWIGFAALATILLAHPAAALSVWTGYDVAFSKAGFADPADSANQDAITSAVALTRGSTRGIFNAVLESSYDKPINSSPADTEWAFAFGNPSEVLSATNYAALEFDAWRAAHDGEPHSTVGQNAVLHLISEDIYLDIRFTEWGGAASGGSFAYLRSVVPEPSSALLVGLGLAGLAARLRREPAARRG